MGKNRKKTARRKHTVQRFSQKVLNTGHQERVQELTTIRNAMSSLWTGKFAETIHLFSRELVFNENGKTFWVIRRGDSHLLMLENFEHKTRQFSIIYGSRERAISNIIWRVSIPMDNYRLEPCDYTPRTPSLWRTSLHSTVVTSSEVPPPTR